MTTYSAGQTFYAYLDAEGKLATPLYDGQAPATKYLVDRLVRKVLKDDLETWRYPAWTDFKDYKLYNATRKAHDKKLRAHARATLMSGFKLQTYKLVPNVAEATNE